ncbi:hypothetical protein T11_1116 [Trichinella zimbabwensis]|uniref:Uncharacterized protein n=1 Tax=Trichinella zimbabwensis TaxID=268475 RepID=A0A0V1HPA1_9BILA|nr:hypothetical protein T11_1116 [Trichinella zimbabwensis]
MSSRKCLSSPDSFCHICGSFVVKSKRQKITDFVKKAYFAYFGIKLGDQYKTWAPHIVGQQPSGASTKRTAALSCITKRTTTVGGEH